MSQKPFQRDGRVVKGEAQAPSSTPKDYTFPRIRKEGEGSYATTKAKYGPLAAGDPDRHVRSQKDARFSLNPLVREPLSIEEEERRMVEDRVRERVGAVAEQAKAEAAKVGYQEGLKKGHEDAYRQFQEEGGARLARLDETLSALEGAKSEIFHANEQFLMEMVFRIARVVVLRELTTDKEYVLRLSKELLDRVGVRENISIRVNPEDVGTIGMLREGLEKFLGGLKNVNIEPSPAVKRGGCMIDTEWNALDASIETQLNGVYEALTARKSSEESGA